MSQDVTFRRIRGRIVPIRLTKKQKDAAVGVGMVGAGVGLGVAAGRAQKVAHRLERHFQTKSVISNFAKMRSEAEIKRLGRGTLFGFAHAQKAAKFKSASINYMKLSKRVVQTSMVARPAFILASSALAASGLYKASRDKDPESKGAKAAAFGTAVSGTAFASGFLGRKSFKRAIPKILKTLSRGV